MVISVVLKSYSFLDITISCPIYYFMGYKCHGCGLTTATSRLLHLDIQGAYDANALVFIVLPFLTFLLLRHWIQFVREQEKEFLVK